MFQFPLVETASRDDEQILQLRRTQQRESDEIIHLLSHQKIHAIFHHFAFLPEERNDKWIEIKHADIQDYPLPRVIDRYLEKNGID